jgi:hypothetical protein
LLPSFSEESIAFLSRLSQLALADNEASSIADLVALAYWLRKASITNVLKEGLSKAPSNALIKPLGIAFHNAPANVDTIFVYSWALSLIAGNINIMRISQTPGVQTAILIRLINTALSEFESIRNRTVILTYPHNDAASAYF